MHLGAPMASAQAPYQLVPVLTDQTPVTASDLQGTPAAHIANDAGDFAWFGQRFSAVFYRGAGTPQAIRVLQLGDEVAGLPGSRVLNVFTPLLMNSSGLIAFRADVLTTSRITNAIFTFDGTTLQVIATGADTAPGTGGKKFERAMTLIDLNSNGDLLFGSTLIPNGSSVAAVPTVFLKTAGGAISRIAGPGTRRRARAAPSPPRTAPRSVIRDRSCSARPSPAAPAPPRSSRGRAERSGKFWRRATRIRSAARSGTT